MAKIDKAKEKLAKITMRTKVFSVATMAIFVGIVLSVFFPFAVDPETFTDPVKRSAWFVNTVIAVGLITIGLVAFQTIGTDMLKNKANGRYQISINGRYSDDGQTLITEGYKQKREKIREYDAHFYDWKSWYDIKELRETKLDLLKLCGTEEPELVLDNIDEIKNPEVLCDHIEIEKKHWWSKPKVTEVKGYPIKLKNGKIIVTKTEEQVEAIQKIKDGKVTITPFDANYYLTVDSIVLNVRQVNKDATLMKLKRENQVFNRTFKIVTSILTSVFMAMLTVKDFSSLTSAEAWFLLISRLGYFGGGIVTGWVGADTDVKFDTDMVNSRSDMLETFYTDIKLRRYVPMTYEEKVNKELKDYERKQQIDEEDDGRTPKVYVGELSEGNTRESVSDGLERREDSPLPVEAE